MRDPRRRFRWAALLVAALLATACSRPPTSATPSRATDGRYLGDTTARTAPAPLDNVPLDNVPLDNVPLEDAASATTAPASRPPDTAAPAPPPQLAWYTLDHDLEVTWSTYEVRDLRGDVVEHTALSRHVDLTNSDWRIVVTTRPAGVVVATPAGAEPLRLRDRDVEGVTSDGHLAAVWSVPDAVVSVTIDAPRADPAAVLDMAAHVRRLSNEQAYWLAPVVSVPGSPRALFDADDAKRFARAVRAELLESGLRVGEPEASPDGLFYAGTTRDGAELQLWVGPGAYSPMTYGNQTIVGERDVTARVISYSGWRFELLLVAPERSWNANTARDLVARLERLGPPLHLGRTA